MVGQSPYSASKIAADHIALSFYRSFDLPVKVVRPFNTYGPRQSARAVIPTVTTQILSGEKNIKLGNLTPTRDLTFVEDTAQGFIEILNSEKLYGEITNIGTGSEISIQQLVELIAELLQANVEIDSVRERVRPEKSEVERLLCNNTKIMENTNWKPEFDLKQGLIKTINWLKSHLEMYKSEIYNV